MITQINILHNRPAVGETIAWSLRFAYCLNAVYIRDAAAIHAKLQVQILVLTDFTNLDLLLQAGHYLNCPIILMTDNLENDNVVEALFAGVTAVADLSKGPEAVIEKVQQVMLQQTDEGSVLIQKLLSLNGYAEKPNDEKHYNLTAKEKEILKLMRESNHLKLIAQKTNTSYETVRTHVKHIYKKLGVMSASEAVIKAIRMEL